MLSHYQSKVELAMPNEFKNVPAIEKCFSILQFFANSRQSLGISEISKQLKLNKSTVFNIIYTLKNLEILEQYQDGKFHFGTLLYLLGNANGKKWNSFKGLNLAVHDVHKLAEAFIAWYREGSNELLEQYSTNCLDRVWRVQDFSSFMSLMLHRYSDDDGFRGRLQRAQLEYICNSEAASRSLAENYAGLPHI